ncbi:MAG: DUF3530 family protein [Methylococcaceae bacterium]|jgi:alpha/beta superfamily hydrolase
MPFTVKVLALLLAFGEVITAYAGDAKRESIIADDIIKQLNNKQVLWLDAQGNKFLGLYSEAVSPDTKGAAILLHDLDGHPNQQPLIYNLRAQLPEHGWLTLALQMPLREAGAKLEDYTGLLPEAKARILAGITYIKQKNVNNIVLIGYGLGGLMAITALAEPMPDIKALVILSLPTPNSSALSTLNVLKAIKIPIFDIYAEDDAPEIVAAASERRLMAKENSVYRQLKVDDEDHFYQRQEGFLVKRIYGWLGRVSGASQ